MGHGPKGSRFANVVRGTPITTVEANILGRQGWASFRHSAPFGERMELDMVETS